MAGAGQDPNLVSVPQGPLVSPAADVLNPSAVDNLVDAFRKGFVTSQDVIDRIGDIGKAKKQALMQTLAEHVSPEAINSRMAAYKAAGAQAQLAQSQAEAAQPLVQPQADVAALGLQAQKAGIVAGPTGLAAFQDTAPWYGDSPDHYKTENGQPDFMEMTKVGNQRKVELGIAQNWLDMLTPTAQKEIIGANGQKELHDFNKFGVDVTPPNPQFGVKGSDAYWAYAKQAQKYLPSGHPAFGRLIMSPAGISGDAGGPPPGSPPNPHSLFETPTAPTTYATGVTGQEPGNISAARAALAQAGMDPVDVNKLTPQEVLARAAQLSPLVTPAQVPTGVSPNAPVIQPAPQNTAPAVIQPTAPVQHTGIPLGPAQTPAEAVTSLYAVPAVKKWSEAQDVYQKFTDAAKTAQSNPTAISDLGLAEAYSKMFDPQSTIREFKWEALAKSRPLFDIIKDFKPIILREHTFPPEVRQRIIDSGLGNIEGADKAVAPTFADFEQRNPGVLDARQRAVLSGVPIRQQFGLQGTAASPSRPGGKLVNIPGVGKGFMYPDGSFVPQ